MGLFSKPTYEEMMLPFVFSQTKEDVEAGVLGITAYGYVAGERKFCYAAYSMKKSVMYENGDYDGIINMLKDSINKRIKVTFKIKKGKVKDFKFDLASLVSQYQDDRFNNLELLGWGMPDKLL